METPAGPQRSRRVLGVFAKQPEAGKVKTRLAAATSATWAAQVALAFLRDLTRRLEAIAAQKFVVYSPSSAGPYFATLFADRFQLLPQAEGDLGQRLAAFLAGQLAAGAESVVVLGTDSPTLPTEFIERAFTELEQADVVLGPATDGGYYLVGCRCRVPPIFEGVTWGSRRVLAETITRLADESWRPALLPPWYDVDTLDDWWSLQGHVAALRRAGCDPGVPFTEALFREFPTG